MEVKKNNKREMRIQELPTNESREVLIAFSSETPVERCINGKTYQEILIHSPDAVDLSRLKNGAALLFNHDFDKHIGIVEDANIDTDKIGRALVRFSNIGLGDEKYLQVQEGVLRKVSVGYEINDYQIDGDNLFVTKWSPYEISMVSVPADDLVGVGRAKNNDEVDNESTELEQSEVEAESTEPEQQDEVEPEQPKDAEDENTERSSEDESTETTQDEVTEEVNETEPEPEQDDSESINKEEQRIAELQGMARVFKLDVTEAIAKGISVEEFKRQLKQPIKDDHNIMDNKFSLRNSLSVMSNLDADIEGLDMGVRGVKVPANALRAVNTTTGANLIQETIAYDSYIDILRANSVLAKFPLTVISGLEGDGKLSLPALNSDFTDSFGFVAEDGSSPEATPVFGKVILQPTDFTGSVYLTRIMMKSSAAAERYTTDAMIQGAASQLEKHVLANVAAEAVAAGNTAAVATIDFDAVVDAMGALGSKNVASSSVVAVMSPATRASARKQVIKGNTSATFLVMGQGDNQLLAGEIPVIESTLVADGQVILGDFSQIVIAQWGSDVELDRDTTTSRNRGGLYLRIWATMDTKVARPESFYVLTVSTGA